MFVICVPWKRKDGFMWFIIPMWCSCNWAVLWHVRFLLTKRHSIARPWGRGMECPLWVHSLLYIEYPSLVIVTVYVISYYDAPYYKEVPLFMLNDKHGYIAPMNRLHGSSFSGHGIIPHQTTVRGINSRLHGSLFVRTWSGVIPH